MAVSGQNIEHLIQKLGSSSPSTLKKTLAIVAKLSKKSEDVKIFREKGGLGILLSLLNGASSSIIDMLMSAIANCSMFYECKKEIRKLDGIIAIVSVLKTQKSTSILNRTARALGNLAEDVENATVIEELGAIEELAKSLDELTDPDCQQSVLRSLKIICTTQVRKRLMLNEGCLKNIVDLLKSDIQATQSASIKTLCELTKNCPKELALQIQEFEGIKEIVKLASNEKHSICSAAVNCMVNLCVHAHVRVSIGSEGGVDVLYKHAKLTSHIHLSQKALEGLCYCCREAINRNRVLECGGIDLLLKYFSEPGHNTSLYRKIITAFNCFYYNEKCLEILLNGGIVLPLLSYLRRTIQTSHVSDHYECDDAFDQESFTSDFSSPSASPRTMPSVSDSSNLSLNEMFLEEAANLAIQVRDAKESSQMVSFKRKRAKPVLTPSPSAKSIGQSSSLFSFSCLDSTTETTSFIGKCTMSGRSITSPFTPVHSQPRTLICSTPSHGSTSILAPTEKEIEQDIITPVITCTAESPIRFPCSKSDTNIQLSSPIASPPKDFNSLVNFNSPNIDDQSFQQKRTLFPFLSSPKTDKSLVPYSHSPGHSALLLLSRFNQMPDQRGLSYIATKSCMTVLLDYISFVEMPSPKCARMLNNLTVDPLYFENFVNMGIPCSIHLQLFSGLTESYIIEETAPSTDNVNVGSVEDGIDLKDDTLSRRIPENILPRCRSIGIKLLDNLACHTQTAFGKGVLMHLLSKGSGDELLGGLVSLPFICRSKKLQNELLILKGGLKSLCDALLLTHTDKVFGMLVYALSFLSKELNVEISTSLPQNEMQLEGSVDGFSGESTPKRQKLCKQQSDVNVDVDKNVLPQSNASSLNNTCMYLNNQFGPYDIQLETDSGERIPAHRQILSKSSDVFNAMLSKNYKEGSLYRVQLKEVSHNVLSMAVHKAYGCHFPEPLFTEASTLCCQVNDILNSLNSDVKFEFVIEVLAMADKFLLTELKHFCEGFLPLLVNDSNIVSLGLAAARYQSDSLCEFGMKFLMVKCNNISRQCYLAKQLFTSTEKEKLVHYLSSVLIEYLQKKIW